MIIRELVTRLGFDADDQAVRDFDKGLKTIRRTAQVAVVAIGVMTTAVVGLVTTTANAGDELAKTSDRLGVQIDELEELRYVADQAGIAQGTLDMALQRVTRRLAEAAQGSGEAKNALHELGIDAKAINEMGTGDALGLIADRLSGVENHADRVRLAFKFFDSEGVALVNMLRDGSIGLDEMRQRFRDLGGGIGEEAARMSERFTTARTDMLTAVNSIRHGIATSLMPGVIQAAEAVTAWVMANRELIQQRLDRIMEVVTRALRFFWSTGVAVVGVMNDLVQYTGGWENTLRLLAFALAGLGLARVLGMLRMLPVALKAVRAGILLTSRAFLATPIGAIVALIVLLMDELWNLRQGNATVIERFVGDWENLSANVMRVVNAIKAVAIPVWNLFVAALDRVSFAFAPIVSAANNMVKAVVSLFKGDLSGAVGYWLDSLGNMIDMVRRMGQIVLDALAEVGRGIVSVLRAPIEAFISWFENAVGRIKQVAADAVPDWMKSAAGGISSAVSTAGQFISDRASDVGGFFGGRSGARDAQTASAGGGAGGNRTEFNISNDIALAVPEGTPDFQRRAMERDVERMVEDAWRRNMRQTLSNFPEVE